MSSGADEWVRCAPFLAPALALDPTHSLEEIETLCRTMPGRYQFWPGRVSAAVTQVIDYPRIRDLHIWLAGGDIEELQDALSSIDAFGRAAGCHRVTTYARKGFERVLAPYGYQLQFVALAKDLTHGLEED